MTSISVIIPAYNAEKTVAKSIESCLRQTVRPHEIIVVDDGSRDGTHEAASRFPAPVRALRKENGGPASARNHGARAATGEWLAMLDADDTWSPVKLEQQLRFASSDVGVVHCFAQHSRRDVPDVVTFDDLWEQNCIINSSVLVRREVFDALGGFDEDRRLIAVEDYNLWLRIAAAGWKIRTCPQVLVDYARGVGISSHTEKFFKAAAFNIARLGEQLALPPERTAAKLESVYASLGSAARFERNLPLARYAFREAIRIRPSPGNLANFAVSHLPSVALDARRQVVETLRSLTGEEDHTADGNGIKFAERGPLLMVVVDTEEEFDWARVPLPTTSIVALRSLDRAQEIFDRMKVTPTYAVDYSVVSQEDGKSALARIHADGRCEIGAHLHPWINPPVLEQLSPANSFPGNLPRDLEAAKLAHLTETLTTRYGKRPILYRAGRYGIGPNTPSILAELGYRIDCSHLPFFDLTRMGGPDFRKSRIDPHWLDRTAGLMEVPTTVGVVGALSAFGRSIHPLISGPREESLRLPGVFARLHLVNRVRLTPEGVSLREAKQLTRALIRERNQQIFVLSFHSPSLEPGNTPYVRTDQDLREFLAWIDGYLRFFTGELGGRSVTPPQLLDMVDDAPALARAA